MISNTRKRPMETKETIESCLEYFLLLCSSVNLTRFEIPNSFIILFCLFSQIIKDSSIIIRIKDINFIIKAAFYNELSFPSEAELLNTWQKNMGKRERNSSIVKPFLISLLKSNEGKTL